MNSLVGYTGFVGSNLNAAGVFDGKYNTKNIEMAYGTEPDLLVYAGVRAAKFLANKNPEEDWQSVRTALLNIRAINPKKLVLISTVDVYQQPVGVDETSRIEENGLHPYGLNRYRLEQAVREEYPEALILRFPGLFGQNLKKNFIYDMITLIPSMLSEAKYHELAAQSAIIDKAYKKQENGFWKYDTYDMEQNVLKKEFQRLGFTALNFTDSRGIFQFYSLQHLWEHIQLAMSAGLHLLNLATEPVSAAEIYEFVYGQTFKNEMNRPVPNYDFRTRYAAVFGGKNGYICQRDQVLEEIKAFVEGYK